MSATKLEVTEADFQAQVVQLAQTLGWTVMHVRRSIGRRDGQQAWQTTTSVAGYPDLTMWHPGQHRFLMAELKSAKGRLRPEQRRVLNDLQDAGVPVHVWRPADLDTIARTLQGDHT